MATIYKYTGRAAGRGLRAWGKSGCWASQIDGELGEWGEGNYFLDYLKGR